MDNQLETLNAWYNCKTGKYEWLTSAESPTRGTLENALAYVPQSTAAQNLLKVYVNDMGLSVGEAMIKVLQAATGTKE